MQQAATLENATASTEAARLSRLLQQASKDGAFATSQLRTAQSRLGALTAELMRWKEQHAALLADNQAQAVVLQTAIDGGKRAEQALHACRSASASALQDMEGFLRQLSRTVGSQVREIASLKQTVQQQCRQRLELQQRLVAMQDHTDRAAPAQDGPKNRC